MDYALTIWSVATYIEARVKSTIDYEHMEKTTGFSYRHIREIFKENTGKSLSKYILERKIANAAFDISISDKKLTDIAFEYKFNSYDTFTRSFKRITDVSPSQFKKKDSKVGRKRILMGMYAPVIFKKDDDIEYYDTSINKHIIPKETVKTNSSCILYGVPKVAYTFKECTPFVVSLKSCLAYLGHRINYTYIMAVTGASFRLRWNKSYWDGGNVDIMNIYQDAYEPFKRAFKAIKRECKILKRANSSKQDFMEFIKKEINSGKPVISLGIIGPCEAGLITGYRNNGETLLGWNCFQDCKEFNKNTGIDECGYYITNNWWQNPDTIALIAIGDEIKANISQKEIIENALNIMNTNTIKVNTGNRSMQTYAGGQLAYELWARAITNEAEFSKNTIVPLLIERLMCQNDAQTMIGEGRAYAAYFMEWIGNTNKHVQNDCNEAAKYLRKILEISMEMCKIRGGFEQNEKTLKSFCQPKIRAKTAELIQQAKEHEHKACGLMQAIYSKL
ncbi:helix-turn-helix transcriptional regulator [Clostridium sp. 'deep sea']|uniref:helix-turn-helix transcriptional regulator n=1 Tax=Clostridium sp. 'deep sea' TaxID=2779445 RepID=UPI00189640D1|nr:helix-turn-helix transcriptional regulator [Clostridium sp. 'deep sea']QOR36542.1 helix-turn-helix transcriptional regulator [Clostridium sp. 'deep sea']